MNDERWKAVINRLKIKAKNAHPHEVSHGMSGARRDAYLDAAQLVDDMMHAYPAAWWFCPLYSSDSVDGPPQIIEASGLDEAFRRARTCWPTAQAWKCLGAVDLDDPERSTSKDAGIINRVVRESK